MKSVFASLTHSVHRKNDNIVFSTKHAIVQISDFKCQVIMDMRLLQENN